MSDFHSWSMAAQQAFWLELAYELIGRWNLGAAALSWLGYSHNAVFRARTAGGDYALRLQTPGRMRESEVRSELRWLRAMRQHSDLKAPFPMATVENGEEKLLARIYDRRLPAPHIVYGSLFEYVAGDARSASAMSLEDVFQVGEYLGRLHTVGQFETPPDFSRPRLDGEGLFGGDSPYHPGENTAVIQAEQAEVFAGVAGRVQAVMDGLGQGGADLGLIHGDLLAKNILFQPGGVAALDFEYCGRGYYLYDLAPLLWQFKGERAADYARLEDALWAGYASVRRGSAGRRGLLETFIAGRQLAACRWLAVNFHHPAVRAAAPCLLQERTDELKGFLDTGLLARRSRTL